MINKTMAALVYNTSHDILHQQVNNDSTADVSSTAGGVRVDRIIFQSLGIFGTILNFLTLLVLYRHGSILGRVPRMFVINQSSMDMLAAILVIVYQYNGFSVSPKLPAGVSHPYVYCTLFWSTYPLWSLLSSSTGNLMMMTIERYLSVCHATWHRHNVSKRSVLFVLSLAWISGFLVQQFVLQFSYNADKETCEYVARSASVEIFQGTYNFIWMFAGTLLVISFCNGKIIIQMRRQQRTIAATEQSVEMTADASVSDKRRKEDGKRRREQRVMITFFTIGFAYLVCYAPNQITWYQFMLGGPLCNECFWYGFTVGMAFVNCCINPIIYIVRLKAFRKAIFEVITCGKYAGYYADLDASTITRSTAGK